MLNITTEQDQSFRRYALRLHPELGEDAYHNVVCQLCEHEQDIRDEERFFRVAIKRALYKLWRHARADHLLNWKFLDGMPSPYAEGLAEGQKANVRQAFCRRGLHELTSETTVMAGERRACLICKRESTAAYHRERRRLATIQRLAPILEGL